MGQLTEVLGEVKQARVHQQRRFYQPELDGLRFYAFLGVFVFHILPETRAFYTDSEGHVVYYTANFSNGGDTLTFLSDVLPATPRFRLTYVRTKTDHMALTFEVAPPDQPDKFHKLIDATVRKSSEVASPSGR